MRFVLVAVRVPWLVDGLVVVTMVMVAVVVVTGDETPAHRELAPITVVVARLRSACPRRRCSTWETACSSSSAT